MQKREISAELQVVVHLEEGRLFKSYSFPGCNFLSKTQIALVIISPRSSQKNFNFLHISLCHASYEKKQQGGFRILRKSLIITKPKINTQFSIA